MADDILVVEYEPRYNDRVRQALAGQPINASFAKDGEEALRALDSHRPRLIVLSSVIPKISTPDLIRAIRGRGEETPILLTVSGYIGKFPQQDAVKLGASDILPKPFSESEFLGKVQQMLGAPAENKFTSDDLFADVLDEEKPAAAAPRRAPSPKNDIDRMVADSLAGVMPKRRDSTMPGTTAVPRPKTSPADLEKILNDSLSGLEKRKTASGLPKPQPAPPAHMPQPVPDRIITPPPPALEPEPPAVAKEEAEPSDGVRFGQYVMLEKIAAGGMAEVWKARKRGEEGFQKTVAIKKILPHLSDNQDFIEMFVDEAKLAAQLNHSNIIHIYDLGKIQSSYYIAMEYVDGHDLKTILKRGHDRDHPLGVELSLFIASKIASALDYAHRRRDINEKEMELVHRDVSPQNVLVSQDGDIKLCDFGIAKAASKASHTQAGALKGKLQYMSPEQAWGHNIDRRSDVFALAAVLFEMLTGKKLFTGDNEISILEQVRGAKVKPPSELNDEVTPEIDRVVLKGLEKEASARYQSAGEMAKDLDSILYSFRPTPTSADLAIYMHRLWSGDQAEMPQPVVEEVKAAAPVAAAAVMAPAPAKVASVPPPVAAPAGVPMPAWDGPRLAAGMDEKRSKLPIAIAAVLLALAAGGFFYMRSRSSNTDAAPAVAASAPGAAPAPAATRTASDTGTVMELTGTPATSSAAPQAAATPATATLDPSAVDQEVQRLLAAERSRLEQQALARERQAAQAVAAQPVPRAAAIPPPPTPQPATPVPVAETATTAPPQTQTQTVAETRPVPAPVESAPASQQTRVGDLVPAGAEGLTPARVTRYGSVPYPPMAKMQKVQGTVILSVLVSETGQVLDVRMIKGVTRPVGLNEAAIDIVRRSSFSAGSKDGVRVKSWATVPVNFKL